MAIEPKTPRKRAVKKASAKTEAPVTEITEEKKAPRKKQQLFLLQSFKQHLKSLLQRKR